MKYFFLRTLIIYFFISGFSKVFSQEQKLEVYFELNEDGGVFSGDDILPEYNIYNRENKLIGTVILNKDKGIFEYRTNMKEKVFDGYNLDKRNLNPFDDKKTQINCLNIDGEFIFSQKWNKNKERFDLLSERRKLLGNITLNSNSGFWELYTIVDKINPDKKIFLNYFETRMISGRVLDSGGVPLPGANIKVRGTSKFAVSDFDGEFTIDDVGYGNVLETDFVGFETKYTAIEDEITTYRIVLPLESKKSKKSKKLTKTKKPKKKITKTRKKWSAKDVHGFGLNISQNQDDSDSKVRFGFEYHDLFYDYNSVGITFAIDESDTLVSDEYGLYDYDLAITYGLSFFYNLLKLKAGLGYYTYNFSTTESFGDFYDYDGGLYYSGGLQLYIPLRNSGITLDGYYNNYGLAYGIGFKF